MRCDGTRLRMADSADGRRSAPDTDALEPALWIDAEAGPAPGADPAHETGRRRNAFAGRNRRPVDDGALPVCGAEREAAGDGGPLWSEGADGKPRQRIRLRIHRSAIYADPQPRPGQESLRFQRGGHGGGRIERA